MAQRVEYILVDDIDESPADETIRFALDGVSYEIDLSQSNAEALRTALAPYVGAGRRTGGRKSRATASLAVSGGSRQPTATEIRNWAAEQGIEVSQRGRVPASVREAYEKAKA